jgi:hypothetical protein
MASRKASQPDAMKKGLATLKRRADLFAANVAPLVLSIQASAVTSLGAVADILNFRGIPTTRLGKWRARSVRRIILRAEPNHQDILP